MVNAFFRSTQKYLASKESWRNFSKYILVGLKSEYRARARTDYRVDWRSSLRLCQKYRAASCVTLPFNIICLSFYYCLHCSRHVGTLEPVMQRGKLQFSQMCMSGKSRREQIVDMNTGHTHVCCICEWIVNNRMWNARVCYVIVAYLLHLPDYIPHSSSGLSVCHVTRITACRSVKYSKREPSVLQTETNVLRKCVRVNWFWRVFFKNVIPIFLHSQNIKREMNEML